MEELMREAARALEAAGDMDAGADARWLMCAALCCAPGALRFHPAPDEAQRGRFLRMVKRRAAGEPLQYVLGDQPFCGRTFRADPRALIPRPETEEVCLKALELLRGVKRPAVLDVGTGTGVLAVTIALERPDARVTAVDISPGALALAGENARALGARVELLEGDLYAPVAGRRFDMIVSNPPYLTREDMAALQREVRREPALALYGGPDGLDFYRRLAAGAGELLTPRGQVVFEIGQGQARAVSDMLSARFERTDVFCDINGKERIACARGPRGGA